jgi:hypothetical protein
MSDAISNRFGRLEAGRDGGAWFHQLVDHGAAGRRQDAGAIEVEPGRLQLRLTLPDLCPCRDDARRRRLQPATRGRHGIGRLIEAGFRGEAALGQLLAPGIIAALDFDVGAGARERRFGLDQRRAGELHLRLGLVDARGDARCIDLGQRLPGDDRAVIIHEHPRHLAGDFRSDLDRVQRPDLAAGGNDAGHVPAPGRLGHIFVGRLGRRHHLVDDEPGDQRQEHGPDRMAAHPPKRRAELLRHLMLVP